MEGLEVTVCAAQTVGNGEAPSGCQCAGLPAGRAVARVDLADLDAQGRPCEGSARARGSRACNEGLRLMATCERSVTQTAVHSEPAPAAARSD